MGLLKKETLDEPVLDTEKLGFLKKGKIRVIIHFEDGSHRDYFVKLGRAYFISIGTNAYKIVPKTISRGKIPTVNYFYNNPNPMHLKYQPSKLTAADFYSEEQKESMIEEQKTTLINTVIDAQGIKAAFDSKFLSGLYTNNILTVKSLLLILAAVGIFIIVMLQVTGTVDILGAFQSK